MEVEKLAWNSTFKKLQSWHLVLSLHTKYGGKVETVTDFLLGGFKIPADSDCSHEIKRHLLLGRKAMTNLDSIFSRDITLPTKFHIFKAMVFPVVIYGYKSWTIKKAEPQTINAFKLWCWSRLLRVPWTVRSNQSILKEINPARIFIGRTDAEAPILWPPDAKSQLIGKDPDAGKDWGQEEKWASEDEVVGWHHQLNGHEFEQPLGDSKRQGSLVCCSPWGHKESDMNERLNSNNKPF